MSKEMTSQETQNFIKEMKKYFESIVSDKKKSKDFLVKAGICTKSGNLKSAYK